MEIKNHIPTFDQFVNEQNDANGFNPETAEELNDTGVAISTLDELESGQTYTLSIDGNEISGLIYQGQTEGEHIFNDKDNNEEPIRLSDEEITSMLDAEEIMK